MIFRFYFYLGFVHLSKSCILWMILMSHSFSQETNVFQTMNLRIIQNFTMGSKYIHQLSPIYTFWHGDFLEPGYFGTGTLRYWRILAQWYFSTWMFQHWEILARCKAIWMFWHRHFGICAEMCYYAETSIFPKYQCAEMFQCQNVPVLKGLHAKMSLAEKSLSQKFHVPKHPWRQTVHVPKCQVPKLAQAPNPLLISTGFLKYPLELKKKIS